MSIKQQMALWEKGESVYSDFKNKLGITAVTQTPTTYTLEKFAKLKGEPLLIELMLEFLSDRDCFEMRSVLVLKP